MGYFCKGRKDRLEMGRYELHASGSRVGFFSNGRTRALLSWDGKMPDCMDRLHRRQMTGAMHCFMLGTGEFE